MTRSFATLGFAATGVLVTALCASCSSSGGSSGSSGASALASRVAGGTKADSTKSSVVIGYQNLEGGTVFSLPNAREGFQAGLDYVNSELGGVNGHPVKAVICKSAGTPDSAVNCGNQFAQSKAVLAVLGTDFAADAALPVLKSASIVMLGPQPLTQNTNTDVGYVYMDEASQQELFASNLANAKAYGNDNIAEIYADQPANHTLYSQVVSPMAKRLDVKVKDFYYPAQADWTTIASTVAATSPKAVDLYTDAGNCSPAVTALRSAGYSGVIQTESCQSMQQQLPASQLENVYFASALYTSAYTSLPEKVKSEVAIYTSYMTKDVKDFTQTGFSNDQGEQGFFLAVQAANHLDQIKASSGDTITAADVKAGMGATKGTRFFTTTGYDCAKPTWPGTTACGSGLIYTEESSSGKLVELPHQPVDISAARPSS